MRNQESEARGSGLKPRRLFKSFPKGMYRSSNILTKLVRFRELKARLTPPEKGCVGVSQSVSYFTVPPRAHPSTGSQSGSATRTPGLTQVQYRVLAPGGYSIVASEVNLSHSPIRAWEALTSNKTFFG